MALDTCKEEDPQRHCCHWWIVAHANVSRDTHSKTSTSRRLRKGVSLINPLAERVPPPPTLNAGEIYLLVFIIFMGLCASSPLGGRILKIGQL